MLVRALVICGAILASCAGEVTPPTAYVRLAPRSGRPLRIVSLPSMCRDDEAEQSCTDSLVDLVRLEVHSELDFAGYAVVDSLGLNFNTLRRIETERVIASSNTIRSEKSADVSGLRFPELTEQQQSEVLDDLGALYILQIHMGLGPYQPPHRMRETRITLTITDRDGNNIASSRCHIDRRSILSFDRSVEWSTLCAVRGLVEAWATQP